MLLHFDFDQGFASLRWEPGLGPAPAIRDVTPG